MGRAEKLALAVICALWATASASPGIAQRRAVRVAVGEVSARAPEAFSRAIGAALAEHGEILVTSPGRADLVVRGSVVELARRDVGSATEVRCEVSMVVADAHGGAIRAMLRGRAAARGTGDVDALSRDALGAAVRGALRPLGHGAVVALR